MKPTESIKVNMYQSVLNEQFPPAPLRLPPKSWEDLASYIIRRAKQLGYPFPHWLLTPEVSKHKIRPHGILGLHKAEDYHLLERLLRIDEETVYRMTIHRFAARFQRPDGVTRSKREDIQRKLVMAGISHDFFHTSFATKVCSRCLAEEEPYGRVYWNLWPVFACLRHRVFLLDRCPKCNRSIPLLRPSLRVCPHCKTPYSTAEPIVLPTENEFIEGQRFIMRQLEIHAEIEEPGSEKSSRDPLASLQSWDYFRLLNAFRFILEPLFPDSPLLRASPALRAYLRQFSHANSRWLASDWAVLIGTFHFIFASWPKNYFRFLDVLSSIRNGEKAEGTGVQRSFGVFYDKWLYNRLKDPVFSFLREGFEAYLERSYTAGNVSRRLRSFQSKTLKPMEERPYLTIQQASGMLKVSPKTVSTLIDQGKLVLVASSVGKNGKRYHCLLQRKSVEVFCQEQEKLLSFEYVARSVLGESQARLRELVEKGVLQAARGPQQDGYWRRFFDSSTVEAFVSKVLDRCVKGALPEQETITLSEAAHSLRLSLANVVQEVLSGHLKPIDSATDQPLLQRLKLAQSEIKRYLEMCDLRQNEKLGLLTFQQACASLGINKRFMYLLLGCRLLEREETAVEGKWVRLLFRREALEAFQATYVFSKEAAEMLGISRDEIKGLAENGILDPMLQEQKHGTLFLLFLRQEVCKLLSNKEENSG